MAIMWIMGLSRITFMFVWIKDFIDTKFQWNNKQMKMCTYQTGIQTEGIMELVFVCVFVLSLSPFENISNGICIGV